LNNENGKIQDELQRFFALNTHHLLFSLFNTCATLLSPHEHPYFLVSVERTSLSFKHLHNVDLTPRPDCDVLVAQCLYQWLVFFCFQLFLFSAADSFSRKEQKNGPTIIFPS